MTSIFILRQYKNQIQNAVLQYWLNNYNNNSDDPSWQYDFVLSRIQDELKKSGEHGYTLNEDNKKSAENLLTPENQAELINKSLEQKIQNFNNNTDDPETQWNALTGIERMLKQASEKNLTVKDEIEKTAEKLLAEKRDAVLGAVLSGYIQKYKQHPNMASTYKTLLRSTLNTAREKGITIDNELTKEAESILKD